MGFGTASISSPKINQLSIQASSLGLPITLGWGTGRVRCNLIWYNDFRATAQTKKSGGKGGGVKETTYTYSASIILALGAGEITGVPTIYRDKEVFKDNEIATSWDGYDYNVTTQTALQQAGLNLATGSTTQTPWGYVTSTYPDQALAYRDIAYVYAQDYPLNTGASIPNHSFEVKFAIRVPGKLDANPKDVVVDLLTNPNHGVPGWGSGLIGDLSNWSAYCLANNLLISPVVDTARAARDLINEWCEITNSAAFWSEGVLKVGTYGDATATANGVTYTPNLTPIYALTEADFIPLEETIPVSLEIRNQADACNIVQVEFLDRANQYNVAIAPSQDLANINEYGRRKQDPVNWHSICDASIARQSSQLLLQRTLYRREIYKFKLPWNFVLLDPMDYVSLTTTTDQLKLNNRLVQIISIEEGEDDCLEFTAEGVDAGTGSSPLYSAYSGNAVSVQTQMSPVPVSPPVIVKAPSSLTGLDPEIWLAVAGANANWGGCQVWVSADGVDYQLLGSINNPGKVGLTTNILPNSADPDTTNTLTVNMSLSGQDLLSASATNANSGATLFVLDEEILSYEDATLTGPNVYDLSNFRRGLYGTATSSHPIGTKFARLDDAVFKIPYTDLNYGEIMYIKLPSFNPFGNSVEDLSTVTPYTVALLDSSQATDWRVVADQKAITGFLTNESHTVAAANDGTGYNLSGAGGNFVVYKGTTNATSSCTFAVVGVATKNGLTISINSSGAYTLSGASWTTDLESFVLRATIDGVIIDKEYSISKAKAGVSGTPASVLYLSATSQTFVYDGSNSPTPSTQTITFTANTQNVSDPLVFSATGYDYSGSSLGSITLSGSGSTRTMNNTQFGAAAYAVVTVTAGSLSDTITVVRLKNGASGSDGFNSASIFLYKRSATTPAVPTATLTYTFASASLSGDLSGWAQTVPSGTNPLYVTQATAVSTTSTDTITTSEWSSPTVMVQNGTDGSPGTAGLNNAVVYLYRRGATSPAAPSGTFTYTFSTGVLSGGTLNGWSQSIPAVNGDPLWVIGATASSNTSTDTIAAAEFSSPVKLVQDGISATGVTLTNEAVQLFAYADGTVPSYATATGEMKVYSGSTDVTSSSTFSATPSSGVTGIITTLGVYSVTNMTTNTGTLTLSATYNGVTFTRTFSLSKVLTGYEIVNSLPTTNLFQGRMVFLTSDNKLYRYTGTAWAASVASVDITGQLADSQIAALAASKVTGQLSDSQLAAIAAAKVTGQITGTQITDGAISTAKLAAGSVTSNEIAANTITAADIAAGTITATQIAASTITGAKIAAGTIEASNIATDTITANQIAANAITATELAADSVTANKIQAGAVTAAKMSVTQLSAITADVGLLRTASTGSRTEIEANQIRVYDGSGTLRVRLGVW